MASRGGIPRPKRTASKPSVDGVDDEDDTGVHIDENALYPVSALVLKCFNCF